MYGLKNKRYIKNDYIFESATCELVYTPITASRGADLK